MQSIAWDWNGIAIKTKVACQQVWTWNISSHVGFRLFSFKLKGLAESDQMRANHKFFNRKTSILDSNKFLHSNSNFSSFWIIFHTPTFQRADGNFWPPRGIQPKQLSTMFWLRLAILWGQLNGGGLGIWRTWGIFGGGLFFIFGLGIFGKLQWQKPLEQWYQACVKHCLQTLDFLEWNSNVLGPDILSVESKRYWVLESFLRDAVAAEACRLWAITGLWVWEAWFLDPLRMTGTGCLQKAQLLTAELVEYLVMILDIYSCDFFALCDDSTCLRPWSPSQKNMFFSFRLEQVMMPPSISWRFPLFLRTYFEWQPGQSCLTISPIGSGDLEASPLELWTPDLAVDGWEVERILGGQKFIAEKNADVLKLIFFQKWRRNMIFCDHFLGLGDLNEQLRIWYRESCFVSSVRPPLPQWRVRPFCNCGCSQRVPFCIFGWMCVSWCPKNWVVEGLWLKK